MVHSFYFYPLLKSEIMKIIFYAIAFLFLVGCSTVKYIDIETYNPAEITFPKNVHRILMVNNALPQPSDSGYEYTIFGVNQDTARIRTDSALVDVCMTLGKTLAASPYFSDILMYEDAIRNDGQWLLDAKLSKSQINSLCKENGAEAVISFDKLLFNAEKDVVYLGEGFILVNIKAYVKGIARSYVEDRDSPMATILIQDSLQWSYDYPDIETMNRYFPSTDDVLRVLASTVGERLSPNFIPYWDKEKRWIYKGQDTRWKEATAYAFNNNWKGAFNKWEKIYNSTRSDNVRAKAAANIALYYEMQTDLKNATEWANKSCELFKKNKGSENKYSKQQELYVIALMERIKANQKLNMQFGQ